MHNVSQWPNPRHLGESLGGAEGLLEVVGLDLMLDTPAYEVPTNVDEYVETMRSGMLEAYEIVRQKLRCVFSKTKRRYDQRVKFVQFKRGDYIWYYNPRRYKGVGRKWQLCTCLLYTSPSPRD